VMDAYLHLYSEAPATLGTTNATISFAIGRQLAVDLAAARPRSVLTPAEGLGTRLQCGGVGSG